MDKALYKIMICALALTVSTGTGAVAQTAEKTVSTPLFITPYKPSVPTYASKVPTMVKNTGTGRSVNGNRMYTQPNRKSGPVYYQATNQFPEGYDRIKSEKSFYDEETGTHYKQYEYMELLAGRGDSARLKEVVADVQSNGIFDPAKYQAAVGGQKQNTSSNGTSPTLPGIGADGKKRVYQVKDDSDSTPQKLHSGYDDNEQTKTVQRRPAYKQPIFLHQ